MGNSCCLMEAKKLEILAVSRRLRNGKFLLSHGGLEMGNACCLTEA